MKSYLRMLIVYAALGLLLLASASVSAADEVRFVYHKIAFVDQTVEVQKVDGTIAQAEFLSEIILLQDGRANGGFGVWEVYPTRTLSLYRVIEGKRRGSSFTLKAQRLAPEPALEITLTLRPASIQPPDGSVTFLVDGISGDGGKFSLLANGTVEESQAPLSLINAYFTFVFVNAHPQMVEAQTTTTLYIASFSHSAILFPIGVIGFMKLESRSGEPVSYHHSGPGVYKSMNGGATWLLAASAENDLLPGDEIMIMIRPHPDPSEPCRIYDIAGTQVNAAVRFEAETLVQSFKFAER